MLLLSQRMIASMDVDEERAVRRLLVEHGELDSLGYFATCRDKEMILSPSGRAAVTYQVVFGVRPAAVIRWAIRMRGHWRSRRGCGGPTTMPGLPRLWELRRVG